MPAFSKRTREIRSHIGEAFGRVKDLIDSMITDHVESGDHDDRYMLRGEGGGLDPRVFVGTEDDGINDFQVGGNVSLRGNTGFGNEDPTHAADISGDSRVREDGRQLFGGTGASDAQYAIQYNPNTQSLDFNFLGNG